MSETRAVIREYLLSHSYYGVDAEELERSKNLTEDGVLDSLSLMELVGFLGERFSIDLLPDDIVSENFKTLQTITALVDAKLGLPVEN